MRNGGRVGADRRVGADARVSSVRRDRGARLTAVLGAAALWCLPALADAQGVDSRAGMTAPVPSVVTPAPSVHRDIAVFGGYALSRPTFDNVHLSFGDSLHAWTAGVDVPIGGGVSVVGGVEGAYGTQFPIGVVVRPTGTVRSSLYTIEAGARYRPTRRRLAPYGEAGVGAVHAQARSMGVDFLQAVTDTAVEVGGGGGVEVRLSPSLGLDAGVGYRRSNLFGQRLGRVRLVSTMVWIM